MKIRLAVAVFVLLGVLSVTSMKTTADSKPISEGGGLPTPCIPPTVCPTAK